MLLSVECYSQKATITFVLDQRLRNNPALHQCFSSATVQEGMQEADTALDPTNPYAASKVRVDEWCGVERELVSGKCL